MKSKLILITGGAGFIGSHLADQLIEQGHRIRVLDWMGKPHLRPEITGKLRGQVATDRVAQAKAELEARGLTV